MFGSVMMGSSYIKFGGLDNVTLGYGFVVNDFTNMLHYPDEKLLGLQFYLNDLGPIVSPYSPLLLISRISVMMVDSWSSSGFHSS